MKKAIENRADLSFLVRTFYERLRQDKSLGPIFNRQVTDWELHFEHITDFWESNLFFSKRYHKNPVEIHEAVDAAESHELEQKHFGIWLNYWFSTVDEYFEGEKANIAKNRARNMASFMFLKIYAARPKKG